MCGAIRLLTRAKVMRLADFKLLELNKISAI